jgi:hypothetical protein
MNGFSYFIKLILFLFWQQQASDDKINDLRSITVVAVSLLINSTPKYFLFFKIYIMKFYVTFLYKKNIVDII